MICSVCREAEPYACAPTPQKSDRTQMRKPMTGECELNCAIFDIETSVKEKLGAAKVSPWEPRLAIAFEMR